MSTEKPPTTTNVELTEFTGPLVLKATPENLEKILHISDAFYETWEEVLMVTPCFHDGSVAIHVYVPASAIYQPVSWGGEAKYMERTFHKFEGWLAGYLAGLE